MAYTNLDHELYANMALEAFTTALSPISIFSTNFLPEPVEAGASVKVTFVGAQAAAYDFAGTYGNQSANANGIDVVINRHKVVDWDYSDTQLANMGPVQAEKVFRAKGEALAKSVWLDILSTVTAANFANSHEIDPATFNRDAVIDIGVEADELNIPDANRALLISPELHGKIRKDLTYDVYGGTEAIREGKIPRIEGFDVYKTKDIPTNSQDLLGIAAHSDSLALAIRYLAPSPEHNNTEAFSLTDEKTKLTLGYRKFYDPRVGKTIRVLECNYGFAVGNPNGLVRLVEAGE